MVDKRERERRVPDPRIAKSLKGEENRGLEKVLALQVIVWLIAQCSSQLSVLCFPFSLDPEIVRDLEKCPNIGKSSYERLERDGKVTATKKILCSRAHFSFSGVREIFRRAFTNVLMSLSFSGRTV